MTLKWRQGGKVPHHLYRQRGEEPDRRPYPDGDLPIGMFLDPADAMTAVLAVNALDYADGSEVRARVSPEGFVAQRFDQDFNGHGSWVLTYLTESGLTLQVLSDEDVAGWVPLTAQAANPNPILLKPNLSPAEYEKLERDVKREFS